MKLIRLLLLLIIVMGIAAFISEKLSFAHEPRMQGSLYDFKMTSLQGKEIDFSRYQGKCLLIVNTASKCGYTPQFKDLEKLHEQYGDKVVVLGFPANDFFLREAGSNQHIAEFSQFTYGVSFQMFEKIDVKGKNKHPLYAWLDAASGHSPSWNFCKYVVSKDGKTVRFFPSKVKPLDKEILDAIEKN